MAEAEGGGTGVGELMSLPGFCFFHFVRRFWNQIFTCADEQELVATVARSTVAQQAVELVS